MRRRIVWNLVCGVVVAAAVGLVIGTVVYVLLEVVFHL